MQSRWLLAMVPCGIVLLVGGCAKDAAPAKQILPAAAETDTPDLTPDEAEAENWAAYDALHGEIDELMRAERFNEAIMLMSKAIEDPEFEAFAGSLFQYLIQNLLYAERLDDAKERVLSVSETHPDRAALGSEAILNYLPPTPEGLMEAIAWCDRMLEHARDPNLKMRLWSAKVERLLQAGESAPVESAARAVADLDDHSATMVVRHVARLGNDEHRRDLALTFLRAADSALDTDSQAFRAVTAGLVEMALRSGAIEAAETLVVERLDHLEEMQLTGYLIRLMRGYGADDAAALERLAGLAFAHADAYPGTRDQIGAAWVRMASEAGHAPAFIERVEAFKAAGGGIRSLAYALASGFYLAMQSDNSDLRTRVDALNRALLDVDDLDDNVRQLLLTHQLDSAFYRDAFGEALEILESGIPNQDEAWHANLIDKVSAHMALQEHRHEDAIAAFQRHIESVKQWTEPMQNPETGLMVSKESVIGFNEKRIGDIYASMPGRDSEAAEAYERARTWYRKAIENLVPGSPEYAENRAALDELERQ